MSKADSIKARLKTLAVAEKKQFDNILMLYMIERLLYRLSVSRFAKNFVLKGGLLLYTLLDEKARATKDIDFLAREMTNTLDDISQVFLEICLIEIDDAVRFDSHSITAERIKEDADYQGVRIKLTGYLDNSRKVLQFDIGFGDIIVPKAINLEYPSLLGMEKPRLLAYSLESVIAEKFEAMIYLAEANSRIKDFYDIYSLCTSFDFDGRILYEAINQTFLRRATPLSSNPSVFSDSFSTLKEKQIQWAAFKRRIGSNLDINFDGLILVLSRFLHPIYKCVLSEDEFFGTWSAKLQQWISLKYL